ncbi:right-handed parallel beta-helix repeat-containing protein [Pseudomonas sp. S75]|uniref:NosD domain-containing protein n=1 Tax=unclassified Pseudomonas TaxID=196821 RepID=UPI0019072D72|nr:MULTISPECIES: right-handed parallel beta-helix repeat-containing protein [unclassified Pseudomonas]MBJ9977134.1 right-handed parallel beta-helix repeat-containing protein [Pseudomonas sp. S30]MBK0154136.1 right-handed parallel beta-helix repeat-containing protein [Pseudomonas sp. S75]
MRPITLLAALLLPLSALAAAPTPPETLRVDRYSDDGQPGTLRWALETSNASPGRYHIDIAAVGQPPYVIRPQRALPEIKGPVRITGLSWARDGQYIAIDGSAYIPDRGVRSCPGAIAGQFGTNVRTTSYPGLVLRDTQGVHLSGLEVRNFCIGILLNRASGNVIEDNRIVANKGGAGIMLTGDDGAGNPTATTTINNKVLRNQLIDNGDGLELTRGAAFNLVADNLLRSTERNPEPSQGIEILLGNDNTVVRNRFENYSDGVQINWGHRNYLGANTFTGNSIGISVTGDGNVLDANTIQGNRIGVALRPEPQLTATRLSANRIWGNGLDIRRCEAGGSCVPNQRTGAIIFGVPAQAHALYVGSRGVGATLAKQDQATICDGQGQPQPCQPLPNHNQQPPRLLKLEGNVLHGEVRGPASSRLRVEVFGNTARDAREAQYYLGAVVVNSDDQGQARFDKTLEDGAALGSFTATVTTADGATSELSLPLAR